MIIKLFGFYIKQAIFKTLEKAKKFIEKISKNAVVHAD